MIKYGEYEGYSLLHWYCKHMGDTVNKVCLEVQMNWKWNILAIFNNAEELFLISGMALLNRAIIECIEDSENLCCFIKIDLENEGRFEKHE